MARRRPAMVGVRVDAREKAAVEALAAMERNTVAELLRGRLFPWVLEELARLVTEDSRRP